MMASGNPNWWSMNGMHPQPQQLSSTNYLSPASSHSHQYLFGSSPISSEALGDHPNQDFPRSWSQLLMCGLPSDHHQDRSGNSGHCQYNWFQNGEDHDHGLNTQASRIPLMAAVKQEIVAQGSSSSRPLYGHVNEVQQRQASPRPNFRPPHHHQVNQLVSSPSSCITSLSNNLLNFSSSSKAEVRSTQHSDHSTEKGNSSSTGGLAKKPRVQQSSTQPALKVRKEKLGDRISALHQLVSPFGKTDTASVLSEAIGYIRFLLGQIEALSSPHLGGAVSKSMGHQHSVQERNCLFSQESSQFLDSSCLKRSEAPKQDGGQTSPRDLRSRGLCLVPISCTQRMGSDHSGADYWSPALGGGF